MKKVYIMGSYDRSLKKYRIDDSDDISKDRLVKGTQLLEVGFNY